MHNEIKSPSNSRLEQTSHLEAIRDLELTLVLREIGKAWFSEPTRTESCAGSVSILSEVKTTRI